MREWEIGAVENIHGALPYIRFAPTLALVGVGVNRIDKAGSRTWTSRSRTFTLRALISGSGDVVLVGPSSTMLSIQGGSGVKVIGSWQP